MSKPLFNVNLKVSPQFGKKYSVKDVAAEYQKRDKKPKFHIPLMVHDEMYGEIDKLLAESYKETLFGGNVLSNAPPSVKPTDWTIKELAESMKLSEKSLNYMKTAAAEMMAAYAHKSTQFFVPPVMFGDYYAPRGQLPRPIRVVPPRPPKYGADRLYAVAKAIGRKFDIVTEIKDFAPAVPPGFSYFEVMCHEVVHGLLIDPSKITGTDETAKQLREMPGWLANEHELATLRIETVALSDYLDRFDAKWVFERANWRPPGEYPMRGPFGWQPRSRDIPPLEKLTAPLTLAEVAIAKRFHALIQEFMP